MGAGVGSGFAEMLWKCRSEMRMCGFLTGVVAWENEG